MKTTQEAVSHLISKMPFIEEMISEGLLNLSSLARKIQPDASKFLKKEIKEGAILMSLKRLSPHKQIRVKKNIKSFVEELGDFIVRSDLNDFTFLNSSQLHKKIELLVSKINHQNLFFTISRGVYETNIVVSEKLKSEVISIFKDEELIWNEENLSSITIGLPKNNSQISGVYYFILKHFAWADIPVHEIISTTNEMTIVVLDKYIKESFSILMSLKEK